MIVRFIIFLVLNFGALVIGGMFTGKGVPSDWYQSMNKAPWTPPGWVFGVAWSTIMILLAVFMTRETNSKVFGLITFVYIFQLVLNIGWNPVFFHYQQMGMALAVIILLTIVVFAMILMTWQSGNYIWLVPYALWLVIATSLNYYSWAYN